MTRCTNNFGPYQYPEKAIPLFTTNLLDGQADPALRRRPQRARLALRRRPLRRRAARARTRATPGEIYNIGAGNETPNRVLVDKLLGAARMGEEMVEYVDRPARPRPPLLRRHHQDHRARLAQAAHARRGARGDGRLVPRRRVVVGAARRGVSERGEVMAVCDRYGWCRSATRGDYVGSVDVCIDRTPMGSGRSARRGMRFIVTGANSQVGREFVELREKHDDEVFAVAHDAMDVTDRDAA